MTRLSTLVALGLLGLGLAGCAGGSGENGEASAGAPPRSAAPMRPALRSVSALATPGESQLDTGAGVYPALVRPGDLPFPNRRAVAKANRWLASRRGEAAFAVVSDRGGLPETQEARIFRAHDAAALLEAVHWLGDSRRLLEASTRLLDHQGRFLWSRHVAEVEEVFATAALTPRGGAS